MKASGYACALCCTLASAKLAHAEEPRSFGGRGQIALSVERLFGVSSEFDTYAGSRWMHGSTRVSFLGQSRGIDPSEGIGYTAPRLALDYFFLKNASLGLGVGYSSDDPGTSDSSSSFTIAPRAGYVLQLGSFGALWPRAGATYVRWKEGNDIVGVVQQRLALTVEAPLFVRLSGSAGLTFSPTFDYGIWGKQQVRFPGLGSSDAEKHKELGLQAGVLVYL